MLCRRGTVRHYFRIRIQSIFAFYLIFQNVHMHMKNKGPEVDVPNLFASATATAQGIDLYVDLRPRLASLLKVLYIVASKVLYIVAFYIKHT